MSCNHPNVYVKYNKKLINKQGEPYFAVHIAKADEIERYENYLTNEQLKDWYKLENPYIWEGKRKYRILEIGECRCGKCQGCKFDDAKAMATRCALESLAWKHNWFITLTYDEKHLPRSEDHEESYTNKFTGEKYEIDDPEACTLWLPDIQDFIKDLRRQWEYHFKHQGIRFYGCGEYGPTTGRAHYHYIFFNLPIDPEELKPLGRNRNGQTLYTCERIRNIWKKGHIALGKVTWESCAYVAQYCTKKQGQNLYGEIKEEWYKRQGKIPEFVHMSRKPGIGKCYYEKNWWDIYKNDEIIIQCKNGSKSVKPSRYYDNLFDQDGYGEYLDELKEKRRETAKENMKCILDRTTLTEKEYLLQRERTLKDRTKILKRNGLDTPLKS